MPTTFPEQEELARSNGDVLEILPNHERPTTERQLHLVTAARPSAGALSLPRRVLGLFVFAAPFLAIAAMGRAAGLLSADHAHLLTQALSFHTYPALSTLDFGEPPLLTLIVSLWPRPVLVQYLSALFGGAVAYALWSQLRTTNLPTWLQAALVVSFCTTPAVLLVAGLHASDMLALLLLLLAWKSYTQFVHHQVTWHGFVAGLLLGLAFFASFLTILFVIPFALGAPSYLQHHGTLSTASQRDRRRAVVAGLVVIAFPGVCAMASWMYLAWLGTGQLFHVIDRFASAGFAAHQAPGIIDLLSQTGGDLLRQPLYVLVGILMAQRGVRQFLAHLFPLALVTVPRMFGWHYEEGFVAACYLGFAVLALAVVTGDRPHTPALKISNRLTAAVALAVIAQIVLSSALPLRSVELQQWRDTLTGTSDAATVRADAENALAARLATQPQGVILADGTSSSIVARAGTTLPFLLPLSDQFQPAIRNADHVVDYVLLPVEPNPNTDSFVVGLVQNGQIEGFHVDGTQAGYILYARNGMPHLLG